MVLNNPWDGSNLSVAEYLKHELKEGVLRRWSDKSQRAHGTQHNCPHRRGAGRVINNEWDCQSRAEQSSRPDAVRVDAVGNIWLNADTTPTLAQHLFVQNVKYLVNYGMCHTALCCRVKQITFCEETTLLGDKPLFYASEDKMIGNYQPVLWSRTRTKTWRGWDQDQTSANPMHDTHL